MPQFIQTDVQLTESFQVQKSQTSFLELLSTFMSCYNMHAYFNFRISSRVAI